MIAALLMHPLCRIGLHRWDFRDETEPGRNRFGQWLLYVTTFTRCRRAGCTRHPDWQSCNVDVRPAYWLQDEHEPAGGPRNGRPR